MYVTANPLNLFTTVMNCPETHRLRIQMQYLLKDESTTIIQIQEKVIDKQKIQIITGLRVKENREIQGKRQRIKKTRELMNCDFNRNICLL